MKTFAVIGLGRFGTELALSLAKAGAEVLAIDRNRKLVDEVADEVTRAVTCNIQEKDVLAELGVGDCDCAVLCIGSDLASSVIGLMNLKALGVGTIVCKAFDETYRDVLMKLGADRVIIPEKEMAAKLSAQLVSPMVRDYIPLSDGFMVEEITAPAVWAGKTLAELRIRSKYKADVIAVKREGKVQVSPGGDDRILSNDTVVLLGDADALNDIRKLR